jgi:taurine transport system substrate-binding protein
MTKPTFRAKLALTIGGLTILMLGLVHYTSPAVADTPDVVRFGWFGGPRPWVIGKATGLFEKRLGTKIQWVQFPSGAAALTALAAKEVDISRLGSTPTVAAIVRKLPVEMIAVSGLIATSERLIARNGINSVAALKGRKVAYPPGSTAHYALMAALKVNNIPASDVTLLALKPTEMVAAWKRGDIDAGWVWGPFSNQMEQDNGHQLMATVDLQKDGYYIWNDYVVRKDFAEKHPDVVVKFLQAFQETMDMYHKDTNAMVKLVAETLSQKEEFVRDTMAGLTFPDLKRQLTPELLGPGGNIAKAMSDTARFLVELGELKEQDVPKSFEPFINTTYMKKAIGQ